MRKTIGYILAIVGIIGFAMTIEAIKKLVPFPIPGVLSGMTLTIVSLVLFVAGIFLAFKGSGNSSKQPTEVPIYQGQQIIGYRRV